MLLISLPLSFLVIRSIPETNYATEGVVHIEDVGDGLADVAVPKGHEKGRDLQMGHDGGEKALGGDGLEHVNLA